MGYGLSEWQQVGLMVTCIGMFFLFFGVMMIFDRALLAFGNILFVAGIVLAIGFQKTLKLFFQPTHIKASACFLGGILLVLLKWPIIGMIIEIFGFYLLFGAFFPVALSFVRRIPFISWILDLPGIKQMIDRVCEQRLPV